MSIWGLILIALGVIVLTILATEVVAGTVQRCYNRRRRGEAMQAYIDRITEG